MDNVHYTVFGAVVEYEKEGRTVQQIEYQAWPPERRMTWQQKARDQSGESREKALEELALQVCREAVLRQGTRGEESIADQFLITFSYEQPYESGVSCNGMDISTATRITPFRLKAQEQSYFQNKFWERYQEMLNPNRPVTIPMLDPVEPSGTPPAGTPSSGSSGGLEPVEFRRQLEDSTRRDYAHIPRPPGFELTQEQYQQLLREGAAARVEDNSGAVLDEETEVFPDGSEVRKEDEQRPIGGGK